MRVRFATLEDLTRLVELSIELHQESAHGRYPINLEKVKKAIEFFIKYPNQSCLLVAEHSTDGVIGVFAGYVSDLFYSDVKVAQNNTFYVRPHYRGTSAAIKLITGFRKWAQNRGVAEMNIAMNSSIDPQKFDRFFKKLNFENVGSNFTLAMKDNEGRPVNFDKQKVNK